MNDTPYFSIIILAYQVEKYIEDCIESVLAQSFTDYEIILITPHGNDRTEQICLKYGKRNEKIRCIRMANRGQLLNRITGFQNALGKYLLCLDGDDMWTSYLLETVYDAICQYNCDLVVYNYIQFDENGKKKKGTQVFQDKAFFTAAEKETVCRKMIEGTDLNPIWLKAFSKAVFSRISENFEEFANIRRGEDKLYSFYIVQESESIVYLDKALYCYRKRLNSITHTFRKEDLDDILMVKRRIFRIYVEKSKNAKIFDGASLKSFADWLYRCAISDIPWQEKEVLYRKLYNDPLYQRALGVKKQVKIPKHFRTILELHRLGFFFFLNMYSGIFKAAQKLRKRN